MYALAVAAVATAVNFLVPLMCKIGNVNAEEMFGVSLPEGFLVVLCVKGELWLDSFVSDMR